MLTYLSWVLSAVSALLALVPFWYLWRILAEVLNVAPHFEQAVHITGYGWCAVVYAVIGVLVYIAALMCSHLSAFRIATNLRIALSEHIVTMPIGTVEQFGSGRLRRIVTETVGAAETYLAHQLPDKARALATVAGLIVLLVAFDWRLVLLSLVPVVLGFVSMSGMTGKEMQRKMTEYQNARANMSGEAVEYVRGIPVVKTFGQTVFSFKRFKDSIDNYERGTTAYTLQLRGPMMTYTLAINSVFGIPSLSEPEKPQQPNGTSVELHHVSYSYNGNKNAVEDVSLTVGARQTAALVGPSGVGKTTVSRLAVRFWDINEGKITVGGMDIAKIEPETLLSLYSIVFQDVTLFDNTIMENIRIGRRDATDEEVLEAARLANVDTFVERLPDGWNTNIGENGCELSGGERQRISIARAFLKNAPIILLDEATARLDVENETAIQTALSRLIRNKTVLIIAHRMRTVSSADHIAVLKDGVVAEQGTPAELQEKNGIFAHMVRLQTEGSD